MRMLRRWRTRPHTLQEMLPSSEVQGHEWVRASRFTCCVTGGHTLPLTRSTTDCSSACSPWRRQYKATLPKEEVREGGKEATVPQKIPLNGDAALATRENC